MNSFESDWFVRLRSIVGNGAIGELQTSINDLLSSA